MSALTAARWATHRFPIVSRRRVLDVLVQSELPLATAAVAGRTSLPDPTAVQHLEDLTALGVFEHVGRGPDRWTPSAWCRDRVASVRAIASVVALRRRAISGGC
jgi:DNA-binding IclR family transcriptional regulator